MSKYEKDDEVEYYSLTLESVSPEDALKATIVLNNFSYKMRRLLQKFLTRNEKSQMKFKE